MATPDLTYAFGLKPEEAIKYFQAKGYAITWDWKELWQDAHARAFTVAKVMRMDVLQDMHDGIQDALDNGITFQEFKKNLEPQLKAKGWWGEVVNEATGEVATVGPWRLRTIFDQNVQTAYNVGRYRSQMANVAARPYWQYVAVMDARTRPAHAALNGMTFRADDPFWESYYPPNGWRCRCRVRALDDGNIAERGITVEDSAGRLGSKEVPLSAHTDETATVATFKAGGVTVSPDAGWSYNPGKVEYQPDLRKYSTEIKALF
jgi:SPP1 gp7 family putative phage head morphogenesis protein